MAVRREGLKVKPCSFTLLRGTLKKKHLQEAKVQLVISSERRNRQTRGDTRFLHTG